MKTGYFVEYKKKNGLAEDYSENLTALVSQDFLVEMLQHKVEYMVVSARWVNVDTYQQNADKKLPEYGF